MNIKILKKIDDVNEESEEVNTKTFLKNIDVDKYKELFEKIEDLDQCNIIKKEEIIKLVEDRIENFKELILSKTIKIVSV